MPRLIKNKISNKKGRIKRYTVLNEQYTGKKAILRKRILDKYSINDQINALRKTILSIKTHLPKADFSLLEKQDNEIENILKKG